MLAELKVSPIFAAIFFHGRSMRQTALTAFDWQYVANNSPA